jgi:hypothetical protein
MISMGEIRRMLPLQIVSEGETPFSLDLEYSPSSVMISVIRGTPKANPIPPRASGVARCRNAVIPTPSTVVMDRKNTTNVRPR